MPKLYEISNELAAILGHEEDELAEEVVQKLAELELALESKVEGILQFRQGILSDAEAIKAEADRLKARADAITRKAEWLKGYVLSAMQQVGVGKISTVTFTATVAKSPPKAELVEGAEIPLEYAREKTTVDLDKSKAIADFKAGKPLPANIIITQGSNLKIS